MSQWVLTSIGDVIPIQALRPLTNSEYNNDIMNECLKDVDTKIKKKSGDSLRAALLEPNVDKYPEEDTDASNYLPYEGLYNKGTSQLHNDDNYNNHDMIIHAEVMLTHNGEHMQAPKVVRRTKSDDSTFVGAYNENPIEHTTVFNVEFPYGSISRYTTNAIIINILVKLTTTVTNINW